jgi:hypothetical protein
MPKNYGIKPSKMWWKKWTQNHIRRGIGSGFDFESAIYRIVLL